MKALIWKCFLPLFLAVSLSLPAAEGVKVYFYPSLIHDDSRTSFYSDAPTVLTALFYYTGEKPVKDIASTNKLFIEVPESLKLDESGLMDRWKGDCRFTNSFQTQNVRRGNLPYVRYEIPLVNNALQPALKTPLPGGMFGATPNNLITLSFRPEKGLPRTFDLRWEIQGKYPQGGTIPCFLVDLGKQPEKPFRIQTRAHVPLPSNGWSDTMLDEYAKLCKRIGISHVNVQLPDGPNEGRRKIFDRYGFRYYGGGSMMHVLNGFGNRTCSDNKKDYLVGLDGRNAYGSDGRAYHLRLFCPTAAVTPDRYPCELYKKILKTEQEQGTTELDIDIEAQIWMLCFCDECRAWFYRFARVPDEKLPPLELLRKYPMEWYKFRSEQTRKIYEMLKQNAPGMRIGANTIIHDFEKDLGELKYGYCHFAEDPRLFGDSIDYILADTLVGGIYDPISVDVLRRNSGKPIVAVAGSSYCVGYDWGVMPGRRMTADMTGRKYGYENRPVMHKLSMLHLAASGASGLQFSFEEPAVAQASLEALQILSKLEHWYLDGVRADESVQCADLTKGESPWLKDESRIRGGVWKHYYDQYCGKVQYRVHKLPGSLLISLFNWDPFQEKEWHTRLPDAGKVPLFLSDPETGKALLDGKSPRWSTADLKKGFVVKVPAAGFRFLLLSEKQPATVGSESIVPTDTEVAPYNQYGWRTGGQLDIRKLMEEGLKRPLKQLELYGNLKESPATKKEAARGGTISMPFLLDMTQPQSGVAFYGNTESGIWLSAEKYCFADFRLGKSEKALRIEIELKGEKDAAFGLALYEENNNIPGKRLAMPAWGNPPLTGDFTLRTWTLAKEQLSGQTRLLLYNCAKKGQVIIKSIRIEVEK